jgi:hypothetical protein
VPPVRSTEARLITAVTLVGVAVICTAAVPPLAAMVPLKSQVTSVPPHWRPSCRSSRCRTAHIGHVGGKLVPYRAVKAGVVVVVVTVRV